MLEIQALRDAAKLGLQVVRQELEGDFLAGVADGVIDLAEPAPMNAAADRESVNRPGIVGVGEFHGVRPGSQRRWHGKRQVSSVTSRPVQRVMFRAEAQGL